MGKQLSSADSTKVDRDMDEDNQIQFILRMVLGIKYDDYENNHQQDNCFIDLLNSSNFDVDKLDYIIRDTQESGLKNNSIDVERLLGALYIVKMKRYESKLKIDGYTLITKLKNKDSNPELKINGYIDGSIILEEGAKVVVKNKSVIRQLHKFESKDAKITFIDSEVKLYKTGENSHVSISGDSCLTLYSQGGELRFKPIDLPLTCSMKNMEVKKELKFIVRAGKFELTLKGKCDIKITSGDFENNNSPIIVKPKKKKFFKAKNLVIETVIDENNNDSSNCISYDIGFKKSAVSNIYAVLEARDTLQRWVHSHHKVKYYADFLLPAIAKHPVIERELICPKDGIIKIDDTFMWSKIKKCYYCDCIPKKNHANTDSSNAKEFARELIDELVTRQYKKTLFKSLPEYDFLFKELTIEQKKKMYDEFQTNIEKGREIKEFSNKKEVVTAGEVSRKLISEIDGEVKVIDKLIWISAQYKEKRLSDSTFLKYKDKTTTLSKIDFLNNNSSLIEGDTSHYFYLFFKAYDEKADVDGVRKQLSKNLIEWALKL
jgi:HD superfamily phosphohydrolase